MGAMSLAADGTRVAMTIGINSTVHVIPLAPWQPRKLTDLTAQVRDWTLPSSEVISWKSRDGAVIEGVLIRPKEFDPSSKYPLLCVIHGGPTGIDMPRMVNTGAYPIDLWSARGAIILHVNYRGSAGYGEVQAIECPQPRRGVPGTWNPAWII
jgi:dipeptidyl aminopeptidase/acylaminoacyl peptidase